jgi:hypothetical protein
LAQRLFGNERLAADREKRTARRIDHPRRQALPVLRGLDKQLAFPAFGVTLNSAYLLAEEWMEKVLDFDGAQIAGII